MIGLVILFVLLNTSSSDDIADIDSPTAERNIEASPLPSSPLGPFSPQTMGNFDTQQVALEQKLYIEAQAQFGKRRRNYEPTSVRWLPTSRTYNISFQARDPRGVTEQTVRNFQGTRDALNRHIAERRREMPDFKLGKIQVVALEFRVTFEMETGGRKRYGLERYTVRRLYTQTNDNIRFHDTPRVEYIGTRTSPNPFKDED